MTEHIPAGELAVKALSDTTKYDALEVGHAMAEDIPEQCYIAARNHASIIDENEYCVVMVIAKDPLIKNAIRRKFYCWPYLPKPRPNQSVFLYNKGKDRITKRLWVLPSDMVMAELACTSSAIHKRYATMQAWSIAFFEGTFWDYIRHEHDIKMLSEHEYFLKHREELIKAGCQLPLPGDTEAFDFGKIQLKHFGDTAAALPKQNLVNGLW